MLRVLRPLQATPRPWRPGLPCHYGAIPCPSFAHGVGELASIVLLCAGETLLLDAVQMSLSVGLVQPNDHIVVVQMISDAYIVKVGRCHTTCGALCVAPSLQTFAGFFLHTSTCRYSTSAASAVPAARQLINGTMSMVLRWHCSLERLKTVCISCCADPVSG